MIEALIDGERRGPVLAELAKGRMRAKIPDLAMALEGRFGDHHALMCRLHLDHIDHLEAMIARLDAQIEAMMTPFQAARDLLATAPGIGQLAAAAVISEIGVTVTEYFPDDARLASWTGLCPGNHDVFLGCEQFFRPGYVANLVTSWIPALDGVDGKLRAGAKVADIGCGFGASTVLLAREYPNSAFTGSDYHDRSIEIARKRAADAGVAGRVSFEVAAASEFSGTGYDLAATFDCLHDMGDPLGAARHVRQALTPDGTWLIVEPYADDAITGNLNPIGRIYYNGSTLLCVPNAISQAGGYALGAQAGEAAIRQLVTDAGFTRFRRAAETPFNLIYEARP